MLNLGQVVYDHTNKRVLIFGGFEMLQNKKTGKCTTVSSFCDEDGNESVFGDDYAKLDFEYANFAAGSVEGIEGVPYGKFVDVAETKGAFFGNLDFKAAMKIPEFEKAIKETIATAKNWPVPPKIKKRSQNG